MSLSTTCKPSEEVVSRIVGFSCRPVLLDVPLDELMRSAYWCNRYRLGHAVCRREFVFGFLQGFLHQLIPQMVRLGTPLVRPVRDCASVIRTTTVVSRPPLSASSRFRFRPDVTTRLFPSLVCLKHLQKSCQVRLSFSSVTCRIS
jgi:hypothetical protein